MRRLAALDRWPVWAKFLAIAVAMVPVMLWAITTSTGGLFPLVLAYGLAVCGLGAYWLGGLWWLLVPILAMAVEVAFAVPATALNPDGGETPFSVVLEAPFWTGIPAFVAATVGGTCRWLASLGDWTNERRPA